MKTALASRRKLLAKSAPMVFLAAMALSSSSCSSSASSGPPLPEPSPMVTIAMRGYSIEPDAEIPAGRVVFRVRNEGNTVHSLTLLPLSEDFPPIDEQLRGSERRPVLPLAGTPGLPPGVSNAFAADLARGHRYALVCFTRDPDGTTHAQKGMTFEFRAGAANAATTTTIAEGSKTDP